MARHAPEVHDEFSYLLSADTFLHGSAANPPHPLGGVLRQSTFCSGRTTPPCTRQHRGCCSPVGKLIFGDYLAGPWLATALLAGLAGWMLAAWEPARWAVFGAFMVALRFGVFSYWGNSYWGGALPAIGACSSSEGCPGFCGSRTLAMRR